MHKIVCQLTLLPMRRKPDHRSEQVSQMLFGETAIIIEKKQNWLKIRMDYDSYSGWIDSDSVISLKEEDEIGKKLIIKEPFVQLMHDNETILLVAGSEIPLPDERGNILIHNKEFQFSESVKSESNSILTDAFRFIHAPYLWGGKTIFGTDCSGYVQILFKINGYFLPRNAKDQACRGTELKSFMETIPGDLLFFENETKEIIHVGLYLGDNKIIHASGRVRIDSIDEKGIYRKERKEYTHKLSCIRRMIL